MSASRTVTPAGAWDQREAEFVRRAVFGAPLRAEPSPHLYVENVFSPVTYAEMVRLYPADASLHRWENPGEASMRFGNYTRRREIHIPAEAQRLPPEQRAFWLEAAAFLHGEHFARTLLARFEPYARARFGDAIDDESFVRDRLRGTMIVNEHDADYYLGPHTDRAEKVFTCLFYFPEHAGLDHLGTTLYRPLDDGFTCGGLAHHDPARFARRDTIPYRPNSALMFARTDVMFHGVHALTAQELRGSKRRSIQMQFWVQNARPREACKTTLWAAAPGRHPGGRRRAGAVPAHEPRAGGARQRVSVHDESELSLVRRGRARGRSERRRSHAAAASARARRDARTTRCASSRRRHPASTCCAFPRCKRASRGSTTSTRATA